MKKRMKGSLTVVLALSMFLFLSFCLVLVEGCRIWCYRVKAIQAAELAEFSILSEFRPELFKKYGLFFLDLDYEQGGQRVDILKSRADKYLRENAPEVTTTFLETDQFCRATDADGSVFFRQVIAQMESQTGIGIAKDLIESLNDMSGNNIDLQNKLSQNQSFADGCLENVQEESEEKDSVFVKVSLPNVTFPSLKSLTQAVFGDMDDLSSKEIDLRERLGNRVLLEGAGTREGISLYEMQLFHEYVFSCFHYYGAAKQPVSCETLEYQLEYIISGRKSDRENLENIMWRIFLLRAGGNYLSYRQDGEKIAKAEAEATAMVGFTGIVPLIEAVKEMLLIKEAIEDGITQTKRIFSGEKVPLYQNGFFVGREVGYEEYLYLFLNLTEKREKIFRTMDLIEMEVRKISDYETFSMDHCIDGFELRWSYEFPGLLSRMPMTESGNYEHSMIRKLYYEN